MVKVNWDLDKIEEREGLQPKFFFKQNGGFSITVEIVAAADIEAWKILDYTVKQ